MTANKWTNESIRRCNYDLFHDDLVRKWHILPFNTLHRLSFDDKGQHLNLKGKQVLWSKIAETIYNIVHSPKVFFYKKWLSALFGWDNTFNILQVNIQSIRNKLLELEEVSKSHNKFINL